MARFRLAYPAHIYATVEGGTLAEAKRKFVDALAALQDGMIVDLGMDTGVDPNEVLYPDSTKRGAVSVRKVLLEDSE